MAFHFYSNRKGSQIPHFNQRLTMISNIVTAGILEVYIRMYLSGVVFTLWIAV